MPYKRTSNSVEGGQKKQPMTEWIVAVGMHKGLISSEDWLRVQQMLLGNRHLSRSYKPQNSTALLSGVLVCKSCGSAMRPRVNSNRGRTEKGEQHFAYLCELKRKSKKVKCDCLNVNGNQLDEIVCAELLKYNDEGSDIAGKLSALKSKLDSGESQTHRRLKDIEKRIADKQAEIEQLISVLSKSDEDSALFTHTKHQVDELDKSIRDLKQERFQLEQDLEESGDYEAQIEQISRALQTFRSTFDLAPVHDKREFLRSIIERIEWDGQNMNIFLHGEPR
jgi:site-specific DNA recombinase